MCARSVSGSAVQGVDWEEEGGLRTLFACSEAVEAFGQVIHDDEDRGSGRLFLGRMV